MKFILRHRWVAVLLICVGIVLLGVGITLLCTKGTLYEQNGLVLNDRVYMENIYVEDGVLHYTVVNKTPFSSLMMEQTAKIYKPTNGKWTTPNPLTEGHKGYGDDPWGERDRFPPFSKTERQHKLHDEDLESGVYCIVLQDNYYYGITDAKYPLRPYCIVGYYTIS